MIISKEVLKNSTAVNSPCNVIFHPWEPRSCTAASFHMFLEGLFGSVNYLIPVYGIPLILKYKELNREHIILQAQCFVRTAIMGSYMGTTFVMINCLLRNTLGSFTYYGLSLIPAIFGGFGVFIEHPKRRNILINTFSNEAMQSVVMYLYHMKIIRKSVLMEGLVFMTSNSILMYKLQNSSSSALWIFKPPPCEKESKECAHEGKCWVDIIKAYVKYFGFGFILEVLRVVVFNIQHITKDPKVLSKLLLNRKILLLGNFFGCYVALYKIICCSLCNITKQNHPKFSVIGGLVAGSSYFLLPKLSFVTMTLNLAIQSSYKNSFLKNVVLKNIPVGEIVYIISNSYLFHMRVTHMDCCPFLFKKMMNICSNGRSDEIFERFLVYYAKPKLKV